MSIASVEIGRALCEQDTVSLSVHKTPNVTGASPLQSTMVLKKFKWFDSGESNTPYPSYDSLFLSFESQTYLATPTDSP